MPNQLYILAIERRTTVDALIEEAMAAAHGVQKHAAARLGITRQGLTYQLKQRMGEEAYRAQYGRRKGPRPC